MVDADARGRQLFEHSPDAIFVVGRSGTVLDVNPAACRLHERTREDLLGRTLPDLIPLGDPGREDGFARLFRGDCRHVEAQALTATGRLVPVEINASLLVISSHGAPAPDPSGQPVLLLHVRDLTERRHMDEQLRRLARAVEQTADAVFITDPQGVITYVNPAFVHMTGYTQAEALGKTPRLVRSGKHDRAFYADLWRTILARRTYRGVITNRRKDGSLFTADVTISPLEDQGGEVSHFVVTWKDITEAKRAEEEVRRSRERYELAVLGSKDGLWDWDIDLGEVYFSPRWKSMLGYEDSEIANRFEEWASRLHPEDNHRAMAALRDYMDGGVADYELEHRLRHKDGSWRWILARGVAFRDPEGRPYRMAGSHTDITERKRAEETLRRAMETAESANRARNEFLANVSHEIRTPLNGILGMTELTLRSPLSDLQREYLGLVRSSTFALLGVINDLLDFSKVEVGRLELDPQEFALRDELADALRTLAPRAATKGLDLVYRVDDRVPDRLIGDWPRLRQILLNLVGNALKFTDVGEVVIEVNEAAKDEANPPDTSPTPEQGTLRLHFSIRDSGIGIPLDKQQAVFEPFVQADGSMARKYGGTGLGLSISARLVERMGGSLRLSSTPGQGSTFRFEVTLERCDKGIYQREKGLYRSDKGTSVEVCHPPLAQRCSAVSGLAVLVVVRGTSERRLVQDLLVGWGAVVEAVADAATAMAELERARATDRPYAAVVLDDRIAGGPNGPTHHLGQAARGAAFVILCADWSGTTGEQRRARGDDECAQSPTPGVAICTRPLRPDDLARALCRALGTTPAPNPVVVLEPVAAGCLPWSHESQPVSPRSRSLRLLVAEDNSINQRVIRTLLEDLGHQVELAASGAEALALWRRAPFDAVLMDLQMPGMDGLEACRRLRAAEDSNCRIPIIAVTAHARKEQQETCLAAGMDGYLVKPIDVDTLVRTLGDLAERLPPTRTEPQRHRERTADAPEARSNAPRGDAEATTGDAAVVDRQTAMSRVGGNVRLLSELVRVYQREGVAWVADARSALLARDAPELRRAAHTIKGAVSVFGAAEAVAAAENLEERARSADGSEGSPFLACARDLDRLEAALTRLAAALPSLVPDQGSGGS